VTTVTVDINKRVIQIPGESIRIVMKTTTAAPAPPAGDALLLESGDYLLLESGDKLLLE